MNLKTSVLWAVLAACFAGAAAGCNKPSEPAKKRATGEPITTAPANTTDSK